MQPRISTAKVRNLNPFKFVFKFDAITEFYTYYLSRIFHASTSTNHQGINTQSQAYMSQQNQNSLKREIKKFI